MRQQTAGCRPPDQAGGCVARR